MTKVYIGARISDIPHLPLLYPNLGQAKRGGALFMDEVFKFYREPVVQIVETPQEADFLLVPHIYRHVKSRHEYLHSYESLSKKVGKPLIVFAYGDLDENVSLENSIIFTYAEYRYKRKPNEVIMPPYASDLLSGDLAVREKTGELPVVGFCGWADYRTGNDRLRAFLKHILIDAQKVLLSRPELEARKKGIYFRQKALGVLSASPLVKTDFIVRKSHGLHKQTVTFSPEEARREYVENILNADLCLAVKGDGNASVRFYEILSLGRVPLLVDTETLLPFEDRIRYDDFLLRVDYRNLDTLAERASEFYRTTSSEVFVQKQCMAREVFEKYLRVDSFFARIFEDPVSLRRLAR